MRFWGLWAVLLLTSPAAMGQDHPSYDSLWHQLATDADCTRQEFPDFVMFTCEKQKALWYFTKPDHFAHPGVVKRAVVDDRKGVSIDEQGWSFGSDAAQPAFKKWLQQFRDLDERMKEDAQRRHQGSEKAN